MSTEPTRPAQEHDVPIGEGTVRVFDYAGGGPAVVLTHGFPDDSRIYDKLVPLLPSRRVVTFDFLGYGRSSRPSDPSLSPGQRERELAAVISQLGLDEVVLVGHDSGGPVAINHALAHPTAVGALVLLNTYYGSSPSLQFPELIRLMADPDFAPLADAMLDDPAQRRWLLDHTGRRFDQDPADPSGVAPLAIAPQFFGSGEQPDARVAIRAWTARLFTDLALQEHTIAAGRLAALTAPVSLAFGVRDTYLNPGVARHLSGYFTNVTVHDVADASHWPQWDRPAEVADVIESSVRDA